MSTLSIPGRALPVLLLALLAVASQAQDIVSVTPESPVRGEPVRVVFSQPVDTVRVTYRPGAITAHTETFTSSSASFDFTPTRAGVVSVASGETARSLSVRFRGAPVSGLIVMILAGLVLFGGAALSLRTLLSDGHPSEIDPGLRPDT